MKSKIIIASIVLVAGGAGWWFFAGRATQPGQAKSVVTQSKPAIGTISVFITATATVQPQNRLEIKPAINGRIEEILVKEGETVTKGQTLAMLSSTERAALIDAAANQGKSEVDYWNQAYKMAPLTAPIDGQVIVRAVEPGQTVNTADAVLVLSDRLIVKAQVDETDIGRVKQGQKVMITLDAFPGEAIPARVDHIAYESELVNNVTIYTVDIVPDEVPEFFRSGMTATVSIVEKSRENVLLVPNEALVKEHNAVFVRTGAPEGPQLAEVTIGLSDDKQSEVLSGLKAGDTILVETKVFALPKAKAGGSNPFTPFGGRRVR